MRLSQNKVRTHTHTHRQAVVLSSVPALPPPPPPFYLFICCCCFSTKALKESFIKAIGTGLGFNLQRVEFHLSSEPLAEGRPLRKTKMHLDEEEEEDWMFEVSLFEEACEE